MSELTRQYEIRQVFQAADGEEMLIEISSFVDQSVAEDAYYRFANAGHNVVLIEYVENLLLASDPRNRV